MLILYRQRHLDVGTAATIAAIWGTGKGIQSAPSSGKDERWETDSRQHSSQSSQLHTPTCAATQPETESEEDVSLKERKERTDEIREKFADIHKVHGTCNVFDLDTEYNDNINVKDRLHLPSLIQFFESIGASSLVVNV